jgi:hypothetical protein
MNWLQDILAPLILLLVAGIGSAAGWFIRSKFEESRAVQQKLNDERRKTYSDILLPFITVLANINRKDGASKAVAQIMTDLPKFQKNRVDLVLFGSDDVVRAHNACWEYAYKVDAGENVEERGVTYMLLWGKLLLEIRRDVGNKDTRLNEVDMLRWLIKDIDKLEHMKDQ